MCKYFLEAVEKMQYGWFWQCPNGDTCHYRPVEGAADSGPG